MASEKALAYHKWYFDVVEDYEAMLNNEQMGELFFAVIKYASTGEKPPVSEGIKWPFQEQCRKVDAAKKSYAVKCETAARNGAAGGRAKARNAQSGQEVAAKAKNTTSFTPPTKTEFKNIVKHFTKSEDDPLDYDDYEVDKFYASLSESGWKINGEPIVSMGTVETAICTRFASDPYFETAYVDWIVFSSLFSGSHGKDHLLYDFADAFSESTGTWNIGGKAYDSRRDAIAAFLADLTNASDG